MALRSSESGQAAVETVALLPLLVLLAAALWQCALWGHAQWAAAGAARAAARASALGEDAGAAASSRLPRGLERGLRIARHEPGDVTISLAVPTVPGLPAIGRLSARAAFAEQG